MNFNNLLNKLNELEQQVTEKSVLNSPLDSGRFGDQVSGTERAQKISVLAAPSDPEHPFQGRLVGADESLDADLNEDLIAQLTQEFADFLRNKQPMMDNILPAAQSRELGSKPAGRELAAEASLIQQPARPAAKTAQPAGQQPAQPATQQPAAKTAQPAAQQPKITNIAARLATLLDMDAAKLKNAYHAPNPTPNQQGVLATAFKRLAAADRENTGLAMGELKKIGAEQAPEQPAVAEGKAKPSKMSDTPDDRRKQGRCVDCGQDLRTSGRGDDGRCRECEADRQE